MANEGYEYFSDWFFDPVGRSEVHAAVQIHRLVYFEMFHYVGNAIRREKHIKGLDRAKRVA